MAICSSSSAPASLPWMELKVDLLSTHEGHVGEAIDEGQEYKFDQPTVQIMLANVRSSTIKMRENEKNQIKTNRKPARILIPEPCFIPDPGYVMERNKNMVETEMAIEGDGYCLVSRTGYMHAMEDGYGIITNIDGDSKQTFFGIFDGHGGRAAVDFVSDKLGKNIISATHELEKRDTQPEMAIRRGYMTTDLEFLRQGLDSGACAASVLLKDGELHAANVGDCRVVMSRKGVAEALTDDHHAGREDERSRIESSGGYVTCRSGKWRVQGSLAVSRAIGDRAMKQWIISEPGTRKISVTAECEFLILATDGLWDKVTNQEAVDVVLKHDDLMSSCKELVWISCSRGNRDDITVLAVDLSKFG